MGYATTIDSFVLVMLGMLAGIIIVQVMYLLLFNYVYKSEDQASTGEVHPILRPTSSPEVSLPFRYFMNMCCSSSLVDDDNDDDDSPPVSVSSAPRGTGGSGDHETCPRKAKAHKKRPVWLLWFSPESSQLLGEVCVAAMIREHQQTLTGPRKDRHAAAAAQTPSDMHSPVDSHDTFCDSDAPTSTVSNEKTEFGSVTVNSTREKELKKPFATFAMLGIEFCGRVFLIPFILLYTDVLMLDRSMNEIALAFDVSNLAIGRAAEPEDL